MTRPIILLDVDDVLADLESAYLAIINRITGLGLGPADHTDWNWLRSAPPEYHEEILTAARMEGFCAGLKPLPGAQEAVAEMQTYADVYAVTAPWPGHRTWYWERTEWLEKHFNIPVERVIHTMAKHLVRGDVLIEDKAENLAAWATWNPVCCLAILWDKPYNQSCDNFLRVNNWKGVMQLLSKVFGPT